MALVIKKSKAASTEDLILALNKLISLLENQNEHEAIADLSIALRDLQRFPPQSTEYKAAINLVREAFDGDHELIAYTLHRSKDESQWSEAEDLCLAASSVLAKIKRLQG